jgi:hypothetical protein
MNGNDEQNLNRRIAKLTAQNDRLREVIESLAGRSTLQRRSTFASQQGTHLNAFEEFAPLQEHRLKPPQPTVGGSLAGTAIQDNKWFPAIGTELGPLEPSPGWRCLTAHDAPIRLGFDLTGMDATQVEKAVVEVERRQLQERDFIPVFIIDMCEFEAFRFRGYVFEYVPLNISQAPRTRRAERRYFKHRLELIKAKWNLRDIIDLSD